MKIGTRITLAFTVSVAVLYAILLLSIYILTKRFTRNEFYDRLYARALINARVHLDKDELSDNVFVEAEKEYAKTLSEEIVRIIDKAGNYKFIEDDRNIEISRAEVDRIRREKKIRFVKGDRQFVGMFYQDNEGDFIILASATDDIGAARLEYLRLVMTGSYMATLLLIYLIGIFFSKKALEPIQKVVSQVKGISSSNLHLRVDEGKGKDEISELAKTFNSMLSRLEESFMMQKTFVNHASHELRTPLTVMIGELQVLLSKPRENPEYSISAGSVLDEAERLKDMLNNLLIFAQTDMEHGLEAQEDVQLDDLLFEIRQDLSAIDARVKIKLEFLNMPAESAMLSVRGNRHLLSIALSNIIDNAIKYSDFGEVHVELTYSPETISIRVTDSGIGIEAPDMKYIYQPFYRGKNAITYQGTGIGLPLAERIIKLHQGKLTVQSEKNKGTVAEVVFETLDHH